MASASTSVSSSFPFASYKTRELLFGVRFFPFETRDSPTPLRKRILQNPTRMALVETPESYTTLSDFHLSAVAIKAGHLYLVLHAWYRDLQAAGFPPRDSTAWTMASFPTDAVWAVKEAERSLAQANLRNEVLVECLRRASGFASLPRDKMVQYLEKGPDPLRWKNLTALVAPDIKEYVETEVRHIRDFEDSVAEGYSHVRW